MALLLLLLLLWCPLSATAQVCPSGYGPGEHKVEVTVRAASGEDQQRIFYVHVPESMPTDPAPALVSFHGCGGNILPPWPDFEVGTRLNEATARRLWYNIYPAGTSATGGSLGWNWPGTGACTTGPDIDDVEFARAILAWCAARNRHDLRMRCAT